MSERTERVDSYFTVEIADAKFSAPKMEVFREGDPRIKLSFGSPPFAVNHITIPLDKVLKVTGTGTKAAKAFAEEIHNEITCNQ